MEEVIGRPAVIAKSWSGAAHGAAPESRVGMDARAFKRSVVDHLLFTCARDLRDASAADLYRAMAHAVRDRLVHRWLATQRTYDDRDTKRAYYLSSEFLTGRSLGLCLLTKATRPGRTSRIARRCARRWP